MVWSLQGKVWDDNEKVEDFAPLDSLNGEFLKALSTTCDGVEFGSWWLSSSSIG